MSELLVCLWGFLTILFLGVFIFFGGNPDYGILALLSLLLAGQNVIIIKLENKEKENGNSEEEKGC